MTKKAIAEISIETSLLYQRLASMKQDELIPYKELSDIISADVQNGARHHLTSARRKALHEDDVVTDCVPNTGIKRLKDTDIVGVGVHGINRTRRLMRRTQEKLTAVQNFDAMPELHWQYGYPVAIGVMLVAMTGLYVMFRRRGRL